MTPSTFTETLQAEVAALQTEHPLLKGALDRAFQLVVDGGVFPLPDGRSAHVRSQSDPDVSYLVNGTCDCLATQYRKEPCVHRYAFRLYQKAVERLTVDPEQERWELVEAPAPVPSQPAPARERAGMHLEAQVVIEGRQVKVAVWGPDDAAVLARLQAVLTQHPAPGAPAQGQPSQGQDATPQCPQHGALQQSKKGKGWYCPRQNEDGSWCKSKGR